MLRTRHLAPLLAAGAALLITPAAAAAAPAACPPGASCGTVTVPLDRAMPTLGETTVGYALLPRRDRGRPAAGTIVPNPGGPGVGSESPRRVSELFGRLRDDHDILLFDPRGVGRSAPLDCPFPRDVAWHPERLSAAVGACGRSLGARAGAYGSAAVADDLDAVRAQLGIDRLTLFGESYGSYLFTVYARRHPEHVDTLVMAGAYPLRFDTLARDRAAALRRALGLVCARDAAARRDAAGSAATRDAAAGCDGRRVERDLATVAAALRRRPVVVPLDGGQRLTIDEQALAQTVYNAALEPEIYALLPRALRLATGGRPEPLLTLVAQIQVGFAGLFTDGTVSLALNSATACRDYPVAYDRTAPPAIRKRQFARALRAAGTRPFAPFSPRAWVGAVGDGGDSCIDWPATAVGEEPIAGTPRPPVPTLVLAGDLDTNTPSSAGRAAAAQFPGARFVELRNVAHTPTSDTTGCAMALATRFIRTGTPGDTRCARRIAPLRIR